MTNLHKSLNSLYICSIFFLSMIVFSVDLTTAQQVENTFSANSKIEILRRERMILVPAGWFQMGSNNGQNDEKPQHKVFVDSFYIAQNEVTIWEYLEAVKDGACKMPIWWNRDFFEETYDDLEAKDWLFLPITGISWNDAMDYCKWKGKKYRLPTEAEWEYAARAGTTSSYYWSDDSKEGIKYANNTKRLVPVGSLLPNNFGLYDMIGNAWEWCSDYYQEDFYSNSPQNNPSGPASPHKLEKHVIRGGGFDDYFWNLRSANRNFGSEFTGYKGVGIRIVWSPIK